MAPFHPRKSQILIKASIRAPESMTVVGLVPNVQSKLIDSPFQVQRSGYYIISEGAKRSRSESVPSSFWRKRTFGAHKWEYRKFWFNMKGNPLRPKLQVWFTVPIQWKVSVFLTFFIYFIAIAGLTWPLIPSNGHKGFEINRIFTTKWSELWIWQRFIERISRTATAIIEN